jgi:hypothetical protein
MRDSNSTNLVHFDDDKFWAMIGDWSAKYISAVNNENMLGRPKRCRKSERRHFVWPTTSLGGFAVRGAGNEVFIAYKML